MTLQEAQKLTQEEWDKIEETAAELELPVDYYIAEFL